MIAKIVVLASVIAFAVAGPLMLLAFIGLSVRDGIVGTRTTR